MHRHVRRLRLTCERTEDARHGQVLLDDALRTADLGDETRLIVVRRCDLGRLSPGASALHWSRRVEEAFRSARPVAVRFDSAESAQANAVFFANVHEPWLTLAERVATGQRCHEWFWRAAVPQWSPGTPVGETLRRSFRALADQGGLILTLVLGLRLQTQGVLAALLRVLERSDLASLGSELGQGGDAPRESLAGGTAGLLPADGARGGPVAEADYARAWGPHDRRTRWLAALVVAGGTAPTSEAELGPTLAQAVLPGLVQQIVLQWTGQESVPPAPQTPVATRRRPATGAIERPPLAAPPADRAPTAAGGLFFILPLLVRAGLPHFLQRQAVGLRAVLPWQILQCCLRHARTPARDPLWQALEGLPPPAHPVARWVLAAHRQARAVAGLSLRAIVTRPAVVTLSPTHIDVLFRPDEADVRIRGARLDFDPGWVPWLSRVVAFHFNHEG